jgi:hypothetical protein
MLIEPALLLIFTCAVLAGIFARSSDLFWRPIRLNFLNFQNWMGAFPPMSLPPVAGRGATANVVPTRFNLSTREEDGDWLDERDEVDGGAPRLKTSVTVERSKTILARNTSPDIPFDRSINPYRGCEHGCVYCYARPTHAFHDLSPGLDFESKLFAKPGAAALLVAELSKRGYRAAPIAFGTNTDPYQPIEREWGITRACLEVLRDCDHPITITTKSDRVLRDLDILSVMAEKNLVAVAISVTSLDPKIHCTLEPRAASPVKRSSPRSPTMPSRIFSNAVQQQGRQPQVTSRSVSLTKSRRSSVLGSTPIIQTGREK